jgi:hypothetical protein
MIRCGVLTWLRPANAKPPLGEAVARLAGLDGDVRDRHTLARTFSCAGHRRRLLRAGRGGRHRGAGPPPDRDAQIKLTVDSDDLVALTRGALPIGNAFASGRLKVDASAVDLVSLRQLL